MHLLLLLKNFCTALNLLEVNLLLLLIELIDLLNIFFKKLLLPIYLFLIGSTPIKYYY